MPRPYRRQGDGAIVVPSGAQVIVESGGELALQAGATFTREDGGTTRPADLGLAVINKTGSSIAADKLVAISGLDATSGKPKIVLADADVAGYDNVWVTTAAIADAAEGVVYRGALSAANLNTNSASAAGDPVYLSATAGAFTHTAPTGSNARVHPVGFVVVKSASVGQILWLIGPVRKIGSDELQDQCLNGSQVANNAAANVIGAIPQLFRIDIAAGALGNTDVVVTHKIRVIDSWLVLRGAGVSSTTLQVKNGTNAITNAMAASGSDQALVRAASIDDAYHEIAAAGTLRVTSAAGATQPDATVYVMAVRVA